MDQHPKLQAAFSSTPDKYPTQLASRFPRVFAEIVQRWETAELDEYFPQLFLSDRIDRQGFPPDVLKDIFALYEAHESWKARGVTSKDIWADERLQREFADRDLEFSPRGFFQALEADDEAAVRQFVEAGVDLEIKNSVGWTPLMVSAFMGSQRHAELLIRAGARLDARDQRGYGPLHWAALKGYEGVVDLLLRKGALANARSDKGITPLLQGASCGHVGTVKLLLAKGAHVNDPDAEGWTALHKAVANGHVPVAELLLRAGADAEARHVSGETPITIARKRKHEMLVAALEGATATLREHSSVERPALNGPASAAGSEEALL